LVDYYRIFHSGKTVALHPLQVTRVVHHTVFDVVDNCVEIGKKHSEFGDHGIVQALVQLLLAINDGLE